MIECLLEFDIITSDCCAYDSAFYILGLRYEVRGMFFLVSVFPRFVSLVGHRGRVGVGKMQFARHVFAIILVSARTRTDTSRIVR